MVAGGRGRSPRFLRRVHNRPALRRRSRALGALRLLVVIAGLGLGGFGARVVYDYATTSPDFALRRIVMQAVPEQLARPVTARLEFARGHNLLLLDLQDLQARIERIPQVRRARVRRLLPNALQVSVEPRQPWALVEADDGFFQIDRQAVILARSTIRAAEGALGAAAVPRIRVAAALGEAADRVQRVPTDVAGGAFFGDALEILERLRERPETVIGRLEYLRIDPVGVVLVPVDGSVEVILGNSRYLGEKLLNLAALYHGDPPAEPCQIDLRFRDMVVVRKAENADGSVKESRPRGPTRDTRGNGTAGATRASA